MHHEASLKKKKALQGHYDEHCFHDSLNLMISSYNLCLQLQSTLHLSVTNLSSFTFTLWLKVQVFHVNDSSLLTKES